MRESCALGLSAGAETPAAALGSAALANTRDVPTILGKGLISFDEKKVPHYGASILRVKDGQFVRAEGG